MLSCRAPCSRAHAAARVMRRSGGSSTRGPTCVWHVRERRVAISDPARPLTCRVGESATTIPSVYMPDEPGASPLEFGSTWGLAAGPSTTPTTSSRAHARTREEGAGRRYPTPVAVIMVMGPGPGPGRERLRLSLARTRTHARRGRVGGTHPHRGDHGDGAWSGGVTVLGCESSTEKSRSMHRRTGFGRS